MIKSIFLLMLIALLLGCATSANYEKALNDLVGSNADNLVSLWGAPQSSYVLSNGGRVIEYSKQSTVHIDGITYTSPQTTTYSADIDIYRGLGGNEGSAHGNYTGTSTTYIEKKTPDLNVEFWCKTRFTIDPNGIIQKWNTKGNHCVSLQVNETKRDTTGGYRAWIKDYDSNKKKNKEYEKLTLVSNSNLHNDPVETSAVIKNLNGGIEVSLIKEINNWAYIKCGGLWGYVKRENLN